MPVALHCRAQSTEYCFNSRMFLVFQENLLITNIRMNEGSTTAKVAMTEPHILPVAVNLHTLPN